jgi:hypothetical protein
MDPVSTSVSATNSGFVAAGAAGHGFTPRAFFKELLGFGGA